MNRASLKHLKKRIYEVGKHQKFLIENVIPEQMEDAFRLTFQDKKK